MGEQGLTEVTSIPSRMRSVAAAAAVSVGIAPNHGSSRKLRQERSRYSVAWHRPYASAPLGEVRGSGRLTSLSPSPAGPLRR
jgi:hypothetical protein